MHVLHCAGNETPTDPDNRIIENNKFAASQDQRISEVIYINATAITGPIIESSGRIKNKYFHSLIPLKLNLV